MKRILIVVCVLLLSLGMVFATGEKESSKSSGKITLTVWQDNSTPDRQAHLDKTIADYMATHPNIDVKVTSLPNTAAEKLSVAYAAGQGPDIYFSSGPEISDWVEAGYIIPLDEYFEKWADKDRILDKSIQDVRNNDITGEQKIWYLPLGTAFYVLWVRTDWLNSVGGEADTWEHLFDAIPKMTDKSKGQYGLAIRGGNGSTTFIERMMYSYSGIDSVFDKNGKCTINDPLHVEFVDRYCKMYNVYTAEGDINYGWTELSAAFDSGSAGVIIHNLGSGDNHVKAFNGDYTKFEAVPLPKGVTGKITTQFQQEAGAVIAKTCKNPDEAFELAAYLSTGDSVSGFARMYGLVPVDKEVLETASWIQDLPWYEMASEAILSDDIVFYNYYSWLPGKNKVYKDLVPEFQQVLVGQLSAKQFLDDWAKMFQDLYDDFYGIK